MTEKQRAISNLQKAANKMRQLGLTCFLASGGSLLVYEDKVFCGPRHDYPDECNKETINQFASIDTVHTDWDGGDF